MLYYSAEDGAQALGMLDSHSAVELHLQPFNHPLWLQILHYFQIFPLKITPH